MAALLSVVESRRCLVALQIWGGYWMLRLRLGNFHLVNGLRGLSRNDDRHGYGDFDRNSVDRYDSGRRIHIGREQFDCGDSRSGLGDLDLHFGGRAGY
jgi:hypothetical protein